MAAGRKGEGRAPQDHHLMASTHFLTYFSHNTQKSCGHFEHWEGQGDANAFWSFWLGGVGGGVRFHPLLD